MRFPQAAPRQLLSMALIVGLSVVAVVIAISMERPWLGLVLNYRDEAHGAVVTKASGPSLAIPKGTVLTGVRGKGSQVQFTALDFVTEPDGSMGSYERYEHFLERQDALARLLEQPIVEFIDKTGALWEVSPTHGRPLNTFPVEFWVQLGVGLVAWLISAGVWVFRPSEPCARVLLLSGWSTLLFAPLAAIYTTRELALSATLFRWINDLNFLGGSLFAASMVALLLCYPRRIAPAWAGPAVIVIHVLWFSLQQFGVFESMTIARRLLVSLSLITTLVLAWLQWRQTHNDPVGRASLRWFLLSWIFGSGLFGFLILVPQMFGIDTSALQGFGFLLFLFVYGGLALGILRFRLFGLDQWWIRIITWMATLLLLVALDLLFLFKLHWSTGVSLGISLAICGLLWLPLRAYLSSKILRNSSPDNTLLFKQLLDTGLSSKLQKTECWQQILHATFNPLVIEISPLPVAEPTLDKDGLALRVPSVGTIPSLEMGYARQGTSLFCPCDVSIVREMVKMLSYVMESKDAYDQGVQKERSRIAQDIHDNLGSQILGVMHCSNELRQKELLQGMLMDLRSIVSDAHQCGQETTNALANLRFELGERLTSCGIKLDWQVDNALETASLPPQLLSALGPLLRETTGNVIKHASANKVEVKLNLEADHLNIQVVDNGSGFDAAAQNNGHGLNNMRQRIERLSGTMDCKTSDKDPGTCIRFKIPIIA